MSLADFIKPAANPGVRGLASIQFVVIYLAACAIWLALMWSHFVPEPVYERHIEGSLGSEPHTLTSGETLTHDFVAPAEGIRYLELRPFKGGPLRVRLWNSTLNILLTDQFVTREDHYRASFPPDNKAGDTIKVSLSWDAPVPPVLPDGTALIPDAPSKIPIAAPAGGLKHFDGFSGLITDADHRVRLEIHRDSDGKELRSVTLRSGRRESGRLRPILAAGETATATLTWDPTPAKVPLQTGEEFAEITGPDRPAYLLGYRRSVLPYLIWWLPGLLLGAHAWRRKHPWSAAAAIFFLAFAAATTGTLAWQQLYTQFYPFTDPDRYAQYAARIAAAWSGGTMPDGLSFAEWSAAYPHTHIPLTPVILAVGLSLGLPLTPTYLWLSMVSIGIAAWVLHRAVCRITGLRTALLTTVLFVTNIGMLRAAGSTSTDGLGVLLVSLTLVHLFRRASKAHRYDNLTLGILILLNALSRPGAPAYALYFAVAAVLVDAWRTRSIGWHWKPFFITPILLAIPSIVVLLSVGIPLGWHETFMLSKEGYVEIKGDLYGWWYWATCIFAAGLPWLLLVPASGIIARNAYRHHLLPAPSALVPCVLGASWFIFFVVVFGIIAVHILRIFVPITPGLALAGAPALALLTARFPRSTAAVIFVFAAASIIAALWSDTIAVWVGVPLWDGLLTPIFFR